MFKILRYSLASFILFTLVACGNGSVSSNSPEGVVSAFFTNVSKGNTEKAIELIDFGVNPDPERVSKAKAALPMIFQMLNDGMKGSGVDLGNFKIEETTYSDDKNSAVVKIIFPGKDFTKRDSIKVVKRDGVWKFVVK